MSASKKLHGGGDSELTRLKEKWRTLAEDVRACWLGRFSSSEPQAALRAEILTKLKLNLRHDSQLTKFRQWVDSEEQRALMAEKIEERKTELLSGGMTLEDAQEVLLAEAAAYSTAARDFKLGLKTSREISDSRRLRVMEKKAAAYDRAQAALEAAKNSKGGITKETLHKIEAELKLL